MTRELLVGTRLPSEAVIAARYEVGSLLGQGGMAEVYSAFDRTLGRTVAVKVLREELAGDHPAVARFRREARAVAALAHPNIVSVFDVGTQGGRPFIVMELVPGDPLSTVIWREAPLPIEQAVRIAGSVASALAYAHDRGIVHRDVKPGNVMVGPAGRVTVLDFGIARALHWTPITDGGPVQGTAEYVSPEQVRGLPLDGRSDVYSLGVLLYEMLAGRPPFRADAPVSVAYQHLEQHPTPLRAERPGIPPELEAIVMRCLAKKPRRRYQDAATLAEDLRVVPLQERVPVSPPIRPQAPAATKDTPLLPAPTRPDPAPARHRARAGRRRRRWVAAMAVLTVMAIGLGVGAALFLPREGAPARASTPPPPVLHGPTALAASAGCGGFIKGKVTLHWLASTSASADGYVVYRGTSREEPLEKIDVLPGRLTTSFVDGGLDTSTTYYYEVRATSGSRLSPVAARARAETPGFCI